MYIEKIKSPSDIKKLNMSELNILAEEIRHTLIQKLSNNGGHVGPNLGFVETTIAMHRVFSTPKDKFVFDISHQSYTHKILTGRAEAFLYPEHYNDVTGYSNHEESEHDNFNIGHTSTSISLALGLCKGRDVCKGKENVVAVIGDGSLSGGEALEGLNCAGEYKGNYIIIVNDNQMSIAENHGGIYKNLKLLRETNGKAELNWFRSMGLDYMYVAEGNNIESLEAALSKVKDIDHPIIVHINTIKGKGLKYAETDKETWHWNNPFNIEDGSPKHPFNGETWAAINSNFLVKKAKEMPEMVVLAAGTPDGLGLNKEKREMLGNQYVDNGIAEEHTVAMASGIARRGGSAVWGTYASFFQRTYDQLSQDVSINNSPVTLIVVGASMYGMNDVTHLCFFDIPLISNIPNIVYLAPTCVEEYLAVLNWSIEQKQYPVAIRVPGMKVIHRSAKFATDYSDINKFRLEKQGKKIALIGVGNFYERAEKVAELLATKGIEATLINPLYLTGIDTEMLESLKKDHTVVVTLEDGILDGGFGEKIARFYSDSSMKVLVRGLKKEFYDRYNAQELATANRLQPEQIVEDAMKAIL